MSEVKQSELREKHKSKVERKRETRLREVGREEEKGRQGE